MYCVPMCMTDSKRLGAQWIIGKVWLRNPWHYSTLMTHTQKYIYIMLKILIFWLLTLLQFSGKGIFEC